MFLQDCDEVYQRRILSRNVDRRGAAGGCGPQVRRSSAVRKVPAGKCVNNFLRSHRSEDDEKIMEERMTKNKLFGVFAKVDIPAV